MKWSIRVPLLALIAALAIWALWQQSLPDSAPQALPAWDAFDQAKVSGIEIRNTGAGPVRLQLQNQTWMWLSAEGEKAAVIANDEAVQHLLADLGSMRVGRVVSHQAAHFARLGVDEATGTHVIVSDAKGAVLLDIFVGKPASDLISTYVRRQGEDIAVTVNRSLTWQVKREAKSWQASEPAPSEMMPPVPVRPVADAYTRS